jgi:hypothetical protein
MKYIFMPLLLIALSTQLFACDVCGGASGNYLGILPQYSRHFAGLSMQYQAFESTHPVMLGETEPVISINRVRTLTAWGRFYPAKRLQLFAFVPYTYNTATEPQGTVIMQGLGDIRILANYMLLNTDGTDKKLKHMLLLGGGLKMPTGRNDFLNSEGLILSNMQPGTASWEPVINGNYTLRSADLGWNLDLSYKFGTANKRDYRYGDKLNAALLGFYQLDLKKLLLLPQAGFRYEYAQTDHSSYYYRIPNSYSGGTQTYAAAGMGIYYGRVAVTLNASVPLWQNYAGGLVQAFNRYETQLQFLF